MSEILIDYDEPVSQYPLADTRVPTRRVVLRGRWGGRKAKVSPTGNQGPAAATEIIVLVTPAIQTDEERGQGDSVNARLHRILTRKE